MLLTVLVSLLGFGLTNLIRNTGAALGVGFVYFAIVETAVRALRPAWEPWLLSIDAGGPRLAGRVEDLHLRRDRPERLHRAAGLPAHQPAGRHRADRGGRGHHRHRRLAVQPPRRALSNCRALRSHRVQEPSPGCAEPTSSLRAGTLRAPAGTSPAYDFHSGAGGDLGREDGAEDAVDEPRRVVGGQRFASSTASLIATRAARRRRTATRRPRSAGSRGRRPASARRPARECSSSSASIRSACSTTPATRPVTRSARATGWSAVRRRARRARPAGRRPAPRPRRARRGRACGPCAGGHP